MAGACKERSDGITIVRLAQSRHKRTRGAAARSRTRNGSCRYKQRGEPVRGSQPLPNTEKTPTKVGASFLVELRGVEPLTF